MRGKLINTLAFPALPLLLLQGRRIDLLTPRMLPPMGPRSGLIEGEGAPLRFLVVGESTALGVGVEKIEDALVYRFAQIIHARTGRPVAWEAAGRPGATVSEAHARVLPNISAGPRDLVLILFGANDVLARRHARDFVEDMRVLIEGLRERTGTAAMLVSSVPPLGTFPALPQPLRSYLGAWSRWLDASLAQLSLPGAHYAPVHIPMPASLFADDGFHPGPAGYQVWAETMATAAFGLGLLDGRESAILEEADVHDEDATPRVPEVD